VTGYIPIWFTCPHTVTHASTNTIRRSVYHRLNGSSSPVLTATSLFYGTKNSTPTELKPLIWLSWNLARLSTLAREPVTQNFMQIPLWGLPGKWVKYTQKFF